MTTSELSESVKQYAASIDALARLTTSKPIQASATAGFKALQFTQAI